MKNLRVGLILGWRQRQHANIWTSILVVAVVVFTITNLVIISGILSGITDGVLRDLRNEAIGDIIVKPPEGENTIEDTPRLLEELERYSEIEAFTPRYEGMITIEANYKEQRDLDLDRDLLGTNILGIDSEKEEETLNLSSLVTEGEYFDENESGYILVGKHNIDRYAADYGDMFDSLRDIYPGSKVRLSVGGESREFTVKGIVHSKLDLVSLQVYVPERDFRRMFERADYNASQIIIRLKSEESGPDVQARLQTSTFKDKADVELFSANIPKFISDVITTFDQLGIVIGSISALVASITMFIIIFINALSRRQNIGILKGIGIDRRALQFAYITQAAFYGIAGTAIASLLIFFILVPYFIKNPIDFPYTNVEISVDPTYFVVQCVALLLVILLAGFLPAWMIVKQNTLDAILGRK